MAIKKYLASADNTITNAFKSNLTLRGTGSNMGESDILEVFSIYAQAGTGSFLSQELSRVLIKFPVDTIITDRAAGSIPANGKVSFYLRLFNADHSQTLPRNYKLVARPVSRNWDEGIGLDMEDYKDLGISNWIMAYSDSSGKTSWSTIGGDYHSSPLYEQTFGRGHENLELNITPLVEQWIAGTKTNYGVGISLTGSQESYFSTSDGANTTSIIHNPTGSKSSFYTKKFFARGTEFFFKRPIVEARWNSAKKDDQGNFYLSSSLVPAIDNLNTLYLYNFVRGKFQNIPAVGTGDILLSVYKTLGGEKITLPVGGGVTTVDHTNVTGGYVSTGVYSASFAYTGSATTIYALWHTGSTQFYTSSTITVKSFAGLDFNNHSEYVTTITNLRSSYLQNDKPRFRIFTRLRNWNPTIYTKAAANIVSEIISSASYKIFRTSDNLNVISYGTGSDLHTQISYDVSGNYFDLDMSLLEKDYMYGIKLAYYVNDSWEEQPETFKFRVE